MINNILRKIRLISNARKEPYFLFYKVLGFYPDNIAFYQLAVRHKSVSIPTENGHSLSNERLEFLGDAVLNSVVTDILYHRYEHQREGFLTDTRAKIVKRDSLNQLAVNIGLHKLMKVAKYVTKHTNTNIYGNALEALLGAIYLDFGYKKCREFVERQLFVPYIDLDKIANDEVNFKSKLIEWCQKNQLPAEFVLIHETLSKSNKHIFTSELLVDKVKVCEATGSSKKDSQQNAARKANVLLQANPNAIFDILTEALTSHEFNSSHLILSEEMEA